MATTASEILMLAVLARLRGYSGIGVEAAKIKRDHRTVVVGADCPVIHLIDGQENYGQKRGCTVPTGLDFKVAIFVREDLGFAAAEPIKIAVMAALNPEVPFDFASGLELRSIDSEQQIADQDSLEVDMYFHFSYRTQEWSLVAAAG